MTVSCYIYVCIVYCKASLFWHFNMHLIKWSISLIINCWIADQSVTVCLLPSFCPFVVLLFYKVYSHSVYALEWNQCLEGVGLNPTIGSLRETHTPEYNHVTGSQNLRKGIEIVFFKSPQQANCRGNICSHETSRDFRPLSYITRV